MNTMQDEWGNFVDVALHPEIQPEDKEALKMAFYAGAWAVLGLQQNLAKEGYSENAGAAIIAGVCEELVAFFKELENEK